MAGEDVRVTIGGDATPFRRALDDVQQRVGQMQQNFIKGPTSEKRQEKAFSGLASDILNANSATDVLIATVERLHRAFRFALAPALAATVGIILKKQLDEAAQSATELYDNVGKLRGANVEGSGTGKLQGLLSVVEESAQKYANRSLIEKIVFGPNQAGFKRELDEKRQQIQAALDGLETSRIQNQTSAQYGKTRGERLGGEIALIEDKYRDLIEKTDSPAKKAALRAQEAAEEESVREKSNQEEVHAYHEQLEQKAQAHTAYVANQKKEDEESRKALEDHDKEVAGVEKQAADEKASRAEEEKSLLDRMLDEQETQRGLQAQIANAGKDDLARAQARLGLEQSMTREVGLRHQIEQQRVETQDSLEKSALKLMTPEQQTLELNREIEASKKRAASLTGADRAKELEHQVDLISDLQRASSEGVFKGHVDSLRSIGGGGAMGAGGGINPIVEQTKTMKDSQDLLKDIKTELQTLNDDTGTA